MWTVSTTKGVSLFSSVWELGTPLFYQCPILGGQFTFTQTHKKVSLSQRPKPHHLMKCERAARHRRVALSHFGGAWGDWSPHTKRTLSHGLRDALADFGEDVLCVAVCLGGEFDAVGVDVDGEGADVVGEDHGTVVEEGSGARGVEVIDHGAGGDALCDGGMRAGGVCDGLDFLDDFIACVDARGGILQTFDVTWAQDWFEGGFGGGGF